MYILLFNTYIIINYRHYIIYRHTVPNTQASPRHTHISFYFRFKKILNVEFFLIIKFTFLTITVYSLCILTLKENEKKKKRLKIRSNSI